jgi:septum formation protein
MPLHLVLASRSPRRQELLVALCPGARIEVLPPPHSDERGFEDCHDWGAIEERIRLIAREKSELVAPLWRQQPDWAASLLIAADTTIVVREPAGPLRVLGQPPTDDTWRETVRSWFERYYLGQTHWALSALCVAWPDGSRREQVVRTALRFRAVSAQIVDWYLSTGESRGKAGGYAIQGAGSLFASHIEGSLSNVVGLPLEVLQEWLSPASLPTR